MSLSLEAFPALLFCPADRPDRYQKAFDRADGVILDLEDAVLPENKADARVALKASNLDPSRVIVRVNPVESKEFQADLSAVAGTPYRTIMIAKAQNADQIATIPSTYDVIPMVETARGVREACRIAALPNVVGMIWGAEDLIASLGGTGSRLKNGQYRDVVQFARSQVLMSAAAEGKFAIDAVHPDIRNLEGLMADARDAVAQGFRSTACIHPGQVATVREAYKPSADEVDWAKRVIAAAKGERGVFRFEDRMVDEPVLVHARHILARV